MTLSNEKSAILLLEDGCLFEGFSFGHSGTVIGEVVFNTGITGYQEVITDPSYHGQLVAFTYPEIGNTGVNLSDQEADTPSVKGVIARQITQKPSNWRSIDSFENWLKKHKVTGISGIDTRALVRHLRDSGSLNGIISNDEKYSIKELFKKLKTYPKMDGLNLVSYVSTTKKYNWHKKTSVEFDQRVNKFLEKPYKVVAIDFGIKRSILERLVSYGCQVTILPFNSQLSDVLALNPEGVFLSNGPGDPSTVSEGIKLAKSLMKKNEIPVFGICLGHQILGLALGGKTFKLPYGHRGLNHPCGTKGRIEITSQNHGFALDHTTLSKDIVEITHLNLNDRTVAGIAVKNKPFFGVQYHPEASPGPHDADHHFNRFISLMEERRTIVV